MKVLLVLAAVGVLGGNAYPVSPSVSEFFDYVSHYGSHMAKGVALMMDEGFKYLTGQQDLITFTEFIASEYDERIVIHCRDLYSDENPPIYEDLKSNLRGCIRATGDKAYMAELQLPSDVWRHGVKNPAQYIKAFMNEVIADMRPIAFEGGKCALSHVVKAFYGLAAVNQKILQCMKDKARYHDIRWIGLDPHDGPETWRHYQYPDRRDLTTESSEDYIATTENSGEYWSSTYPEWYIASMDSHRASNLKSRPDYPIAYSPRPYYPEAYSPRTDNYYPVNTDGPEADNPRF